MTNPIFQRDLRGRWRRTITYLILFSYSAALALMMGFVYASRGSGLDLLSENQSALGRKLFSGFLSLETGVWVLLATSLTAPALAGEREKGLLQGLLISPLTPGAIVRGKLASSLWFIGLLLLVPMPILSLCFSLGGLAVWEFLIAFLLLASTAFSGACIGLATSACHKRSDSALFTALVIAFTVNWPPILAAVTFERDYFALGAILCLIYQLLLVIASLCIAVDALNNLLPESETEESFSDSIIRAAMPSVTAPPQKVWVDTPLSLRIRFSNPITTREVRARLRRHIYHDPIRLVPRLDTLQFNMADYCVMAAIISFPLAFLNSVSQTGINLAALWLLALLLLASVLGAQSFVHERETQTLLALLLTMLSPAQILMGKLGTIVFMTMIYGAPFLPMVLWGLWPDLNMWPSVLLLGVGFLWCGAAIGLFFSWRCRQAGLAYASSITAALLLFSACLKLPAFMKVSFNVPPLFYYNLPISLFLLVSGAILLIVVWLQMQPHR